MMRFLGVFLALIGFLTISLIVGGAVAVWWFKPGGPQLAADKRVVMEINLTGTLYERPPQRSAIAFLEGSDPTIADMVDLIDKAAADDRVQALIASIDATAHGWASAQELRQAIERFRTTSGKPAIAYAASFGELSSGNEGYYLASAFDRIRLQPMGFLGLTGLALFQPSAKSFLDRVGVEADVIRRSEFKSLLEAATEYEMSAANRDQMEALLDSFDAEIISAITTSRSMSEVELRASMASAPMTAQEALEFGLIDEIGHYEPLWSELEEAHDAEIIDASHFRNVLSAEDETKEQSHIALITGQGMIQQGGNLNDGIAGEAFADAIREAVDDPDIDGIVLRLDTGGGSVVASEAALYGLDYAKAEGIPLVVSMSNATASGGYWIAQAADRIVAQPLTITGSIGVVLGKPSFAGLLDILGLTVDKIERGENANLWALDEPFDAAGRARLEVVVEKIYEAFKARVAEGRGLTPEQVEAAAKGRVWSGAQALDLGLVDALGGLTEAKAAMRELLSLPADAGVTLQTYPPPVDRFQQILDWFSGENESFLGLQGSITAAVNELSILRPLMMMPVIIR